MGRLNVTSDDNADMNDVADLLSAARNGTDPLPAAVADAARENGCWTEPWCVEQVCTFPAADWPRFVAAEWYAEAGHGDRAEFVRVQCELVGATCVCGRSVRPCRTCKLHRRVAGLLGRGHVEWQSALPTLSWAPTDEPGETESPYRWRRGFVHAVRCTAAEWMTHADELFWSPGQTVPCPTCGHLDPGWVAHLHCCADGAVPRPFPTTLPHPLRHVTLTTIPAILNRQTVRRDDDIWFRDYPTHVLRADDVVQKTRELGTNRWDVAMASLIWPGVEFDVRTG